MRSHLGARPAEDRVELRDGGAIICGAGRSNLSQTMRGLVNARRAAGVGEGVPERFLRERSTIGAADKRQGGGGASGKRLCQNREDRELNLDLFSALFGSEGVGGPGEPRRRGVDP